MDDDAIHNERTKLFSTALNNMGVAAVVTGIIAPVITGRFNQLPYIVLWLFLSADLFALAQYLLGRLR